MTYAAVHARPDGRSTVARMALTAAEFGFDGIVIRNHGDKPAEYDPASLRDAYGIDIVPAVEIRTDDRSRVGGFIGSHRPEVPIVAVHGGDPEINRFAVEHPSVDVLAHPMAGDGDMNHVLAQAAAENGVRLEINLAPMLRKTGGERVRAIADLRKLRELIDDAGTPFVISGDAHSHLGLRAPRELVAVCERLGFDADEARVGLEEWRQLADQNRDRQSDRFVEPGVYRGSADVERNENS
ncbi:MAG: RNase P subunit p30 family protein [Salinirussus sp.]